MAIVDINGKTIVVPDALADMFRPPETGGEGMPGEGQPLPPISKERKPDPYPYDPEEDAFNRRSESGGGQAWNPDTGWNTLQPKPSPRPRTDAARIGMFGAPTPNEVPYVTPAAPSVEPDAISGADPSYSVTGGSLEPMPQTGVGPAGPSRPDYVVGKFDNSQRTIAASNKAYDKKQAAQAKQAAARAAYEASPEGRMAAADAEYGDALGAQNDANRAAMEVQQQEAREKYAAMAKAQEDAQAISAEQERIRAEREKQRQAKVEQAERLATDVDNFKIHDPGIWGDKSTANSVGRIIAMAMTGIGMALMGRGHEQNPVIAMFDEQAKRSVQLQMDQRAQLEKRAGRAERGLDSFDRFSESADAQYNARIARAYEYGIRQGDLVAAKFGDKKAEANWKAQRAELLAKQAEYNAKAAATAHDWDMQKQQVALQRSQVSQGWSRIAEDKRQFNEKQKDDNIKFLAENDRANRALDIEAGKAAAAAAKPGKDLQLERGIGGVAVPIKDEQGNTVGVKQDTIRNRDGTPFIPQGSAASIDKLRETKAATDTVIQLLDEARRLRTGWTSDTANSEEFQRLKANWAAAKGVAKDVLGLGALSGPDMELVDKFIGTGDPTSWKDPRAGIKQARKNVLSILNNKLHAAGLDGDYEPPDLGDVPAPELTEDEKTFKKSLKVGGFDLPQAAAPGESWSMQVNRIAETGRSDQSRYIQSLVAAATNPANSPAVRDAAISRLRVGENDAQSADIKDEYRSALARAEFVRKAQP